MAKRRLRICDSCGNEESTFSKSPTCAICVAKVTKSKNEELERQHLEFLGYSDIHGPYPNFDGRRRWSFTHADCGTEQTWTYTNLLTRVKLDPTNIPCSKCGGQRRIKHAMAGYMEVHERKYNFEDYELYGGKVRSISETNYRLYKHIINPNDYKRAVGTTGYHLDHIVPVIVCFKNEIHPEVAGGVINLQMLTGKENLSKCKYGYDEHLFEQLKLATANLV